ncbi:MAG: oligopeptide transporter, OPT family, partial [Gammaproteobacteria bacterium]|nr:oligopeptide transporter, OPT family [Gammaproteobacteria bacterium]
MTERLPDDEPLIPASVNLPELTFKVIILSILLAAFLAAANAYLALKIGNTISASIPASVLAISILRLFKNSNVLESNIIQTAASGGEGIAAAISFILPAMIIMHIWKSFPYWEVVLITILGGVLGVIFSIPLRRVMLNLPALKFPEGTAIGNVLRASTESGTQLKLLLQGGIAGALLSLAENGLQFVSGSLHAWARVGRNSVLGMGLGLSPAMLAAGYIIGLEASVSLFVGLIGGWVIILPILASQHLGVFNGAAYDYAMSLWSSKLRFVGVGIMLLGGVWTLLRLLGPVVTGIKVSFGSLKGYQDGKKIKILRTERDFPFAWVLFGTLFIAILLYGLMMHFTSVMPLHTSHSYTIFVAGVTVVYLLIVGFLLAMICAYFTGLVGSTNNPLSGMLIIALILLGLVYLVLLPTHLSVINKHAAGLMILVVTVVATIAAISNENMQDLKAGKMVGATPWKQQLILVLGVITSAFVVGPVLELLFNAYGIGGVFPHPGMDPRNMLPAPQAGLMAAIATGLRSHNLDWTMIIVGAVFAVGVIIVDELFKKRNFCLPVLAVGLGVYLPPEITTPFIIGGVIGWIARRKSTSM